MLRRKCSYRNHIETHKQPKSKEKIELWLAIYQKKKKKKKKKKLKMLMYDDFSKKCHVAFKKFLLFL